MRPVPDTDVVDAVILTARHPVVTAATRTDEVADVGPGPRDQDDGGRWCCQGIARSRSPARAISVASAPYAAPMSPGARPELVRPPSPLADPVSAVLAGAPSPGPLLVVVATGEVLAVELHPTGSGVLVLHRAAGPPAGLTVRELQVLDGIGHGWSNPEVAARLGTGARTVATHVEHVLAKTGARNRAAAARCAARWGLLVDGGAAEG